MKIVDCSSLITFFDRPRLYLAGASAAVFALVGGHFGSLLLNWKEDKLVARQRLRLAFTASSRRGSADSAAADAGPWGNSGTVRRAAAKKTRKSTKLRVLRLVFVLLLSGVDLGKSLARTCLKDGGCTTWEAHFCGLVAGALAGTVVLRNRKHEDWESCARLAAAVALAAVAFLAVAWAALGDRVWARAAGEAWFMWQDANGTCTYSDVWSLDVGMNIAPCQCP